MTQLSSDQKMCVLQAAIATDAALPAVAANGCERLPTAANYDEGSYFHDLFKTRPPT